MWERTLPYCASKAEEYLVPMAAHLNARHHMPYHSSRIHLKHK